MNKANYAAGEDSFAKITDYMMVEYRFNDKWTVPVGKMCQYWGGYEFDANPMYFYQYSDMVDNLDNPRTGWCDVQTCTVQKFVAELSNSKKMRILKLPFLTLKLNKLRVRYNSNQIKLPVLDEVHINCRFLLKEAICSNCL